MTNSPLRAALVAVTLSLLACGGARTKEPAPWPLTGCVVDARAPRAKSLPIVWTTKLGADHPLVGVVWDVTNARPVERGEMLRQLESADFVLLGEKHDNPDHHRLQAAELQAAARVDDKPRVVWELLPKNQADWPAWEDYAPIHDAAVTLGLGMEGTSLSRAEVHALVRDPDRLRAELASAPALPDAALVSLDEELKADHCGHLPAKMVAAMELAQRLKDATMASRMSASPRAVLIAGNGHVRTDRGVPFYLRAAGARGASGASGASGMSTKPGAPGTPSPLRAKIVSVAHLEVESSMTRPEAYAAVLHAEKLPFDYVIFTPRATDEDPCEAFKK